MRQFKLNLNPGDSIPITVSGNYLRVLTSSGDVTITIEGGAPHVLAQGLGIELPDRFERLRIDSNIAQTVLMEAGFGRIDDARFSVSAPIAVSGITNPVAVSGIANPVAVSGIANPVAVSGITNPVNISHSNNLAINNVQWASAVAVLLIAASAQRREVVISNQNNIGSNADIFIGIDNTVTGTSVAAMGLRLAAGEKIVLSTGSAIWAIEPTGTALNNIVVMSILD